VHVGDWNQAVTMMALAGERELTFSTDALSVFLRWHDEVEQGLPLGRLYGDIREFAVKIRDSVARLAGLFARLEGADQVGEAHVARAVRLGEYYLAHAEAIVESWAGLAADIAHKIMAKADGYRFTVRDATRSTRAHVAEVIDALEMLQAKGYVQPADMEIGFVRPRKPGSASPEVLVNPAVLLSKAATAATDSDDHRST
jgi:hypothetical protein